MQARYIYGLFGSTFDSVKMTMEVTQERDHDTRDEVERWLGDWVDTRELCIGFNQFV